MQTLPGFRDFYPDDCARRNYLLTQWREVARRYGFVEYDGPVLEPMALYEKKSGGELVGQLFDFVDKGERHVAMRCQVPKPVTLDLPPVSATLGSPPRPWRLGPGNVNQRQCFATRDPNERGKWLIQPAEPGKVLVEGQIVFEDGSPVPNAQYALAAADGEYLHTNEAGEADLGEVPRTTSFSPDHPTQAGRPIPDRADAEGRFSYPKETPEGTYILELFGLDRPAVARAGDEAPEEARGNVICLHFAPMPAAPPAAGGGAP